MMWGWDNNRLGDWGVVDRHRKRAYAEGFRDGVVVGCILSVAIGFALSWIMGNYFK